MPEDGFSPSELESSKTKLAIIGLGMIGGSLAAALKKYAEGEFEIAGYNRTYSSTEEALAKGYIDKAAKSEAEVVEDADIIFIATPVGVIPKIISGVAEHLKQGAIITDMGSTKGRIVEQVESVIPSGAHFIGGHPMAGSEKDGIGAANPDLFRNAYYLLTPTLRTDSSALRCLHSVVAKTGANILAIDPERHDEAVAFISHLPHIVAAALMNVAAAQTEENENLLMLTAGGFRDTTRIAAGNTRMWVDICLENRDAIVKSIERFQNEMANYLKALTSKDEGALTEQLERARCGRLALPAKRDKSVAELYNVQIPIVDRPGVVSDITLTIGRAGVNIEDIEIIHATEASGILRLTVAGEDAVRKAVQFLEEKGYEVDVQRLLEGGVS